MDQKKTLWIIVGVGAFLLAVLGAACILYKPVNRPVPLVANVVPADSISGSISGWTNPSQVQNIESASGFVPNDSVTAKVNDMFVVADNATIYGSSVKEADGSTTIDLNALKRDMSLESPAAPQNINITVNVPDVKTQEIVKVEKEEVKVSAPVPVTKTVEKNTETEVKKTESKTKAKVTNSTPVTKTATVASAPAPKPVTQYWVQVASYGSKKAAESARSILDENKITSDIFTYKDNKDKLFYRVRVGPYTTKSEAEYWRVRITKIGEFAKNDSYVTSTTSN